MVYLHLYILSNCIIMLPFYIVMFEYLIEHSLSVWHVGDAKWLYIIQIFVSLLYSQLFIASKIILSSSLQVTNA